MTHVAARRVWGTPRTRRHRHNATRARPAALCVQMLGGYFSDAVSMANYL